MTRIGRASRGDDMTSAFGGFERAANRIRELITTIRSEGQVDTLNIEFNWAAEPESGRIVVNIRGGNGQAQPELQTARIGILV